MATNEQPEDRWETIKKLWHDEKFVYQILGGLVLVGVGVWIGSRLFDGDPGYATNLYTEILSISVTVFVLDLLARRREDRREEARLKADLIMRLVSQVKETALSALDELQARGWLKDGSLKGANLVGTNLGRVGLYEANLEGANLWGANLQGAELVGANLEGANLWGANLQAANLVGANLDGVGLYGANLHMADLVGAKLRSAKFSEDTVLPNGSEWTPDTDLAYFTDPKHKPFWRPDPDSMRWYRNRTLTNPPA